MYPTSSPTFNITNTQGILIDTLYIDVEDDNPTRYFDSNAINNIKYIADFTNHAWDVYGIKVGIYTTKREWGQIMGPVVGTTNLNPFRKLPLWTPRYDSKYNFDFFSEFAGWTQPYMKQLKGGASNLRRSGSNRINQNYVDVSLLSNMAYYDPRFIPGPMVPPV
jgi:hypothetical protein